MYGGIVFAIVFDCYNVNEKVYKLYTSVEKKILTSIYMKR